MTNVSQASRRCGVGLELGRLERRQDPAPDLDRVLERLESRRGVAPLVVPEVVVPRAGRYDEAVVLEPRAAVEHHTAALEVEARHVAEDDASVALALEQSAQRRGDLRGGERAGRGLVQQRLEEMEVALVDERDLDRRPAKPAHRLEAGEAAADDDDAVGMFEAHAVDPPAAA